MDNPVSRRRAILGATIGNAIEFYDFLVYASFAIQIGKAFFPAENTYISLIASLATFGAGFVTRPLGAWTIGSYADRHGRRPALLLTLWLMGAGIAGLALTPSYATIGWAAPVIAVAARLLQGFALGGDVGPSASFLIEVAGEERQGLVGSLQRATQLIAGGLGAAAGFTLTLLLDPVQLGNWGWRVALAAGLIVVPYAAWLRRNLPETHEAAEQHVPAPRPDRKEWWLISIGLVLFSAGTISSYLMNYMATFAQNSLKLPPRAAFAGQMAAYLLAAVTGIASGWLSDKIGRRPVALAAGIGFVVVAWPAYAWLMADPTALTFLGVCVVLGLVNGLTCVHIVMIAESIAKQTRARNFAMIYTVPITLFGGTAQVFVTWLIHATGTPMAIAWCLMAIWVPGLVATWLYPESAPRLKRV